MTLNQESYETLMSKIQVLEERAIKGINRDMELTMQIQELKQLVYYANVQ